MTRTQRGIAIAMALAQIGSMSGCAIYIRAPLPPTGAIFVVLEPPRPPQEVIVIRPGPRHVWIGGYWVWRDPQFVWIAGRWMEPPHPHRSWVPGRWYHQRRGWYWIEGRWR